MTFTTLFIDKGGIKKDIPGFSESFSASEFGFWGEYSLLDFALYNTGRDKSIFICEKEIRKNINNVLFKWDEKNYNFFPYKSDYDSAEDFLKRIENNVIVFYNVDFAALIKENEFLNTVNSFYSEKASGIIKISINSVPVDIYIADKKNILEQLDSMKNRFEAGSNVFDFIIDEILATGFDEIMDLEGEILFNSSIKQIYDSNISLLKREPSNMMESFMKNTPPPNEKDSFITIKGNVLNSIISSNSRVEGTVENSVIFSGVTVKQNAHIKNSVIMNGNQIGKNVSIQNSVILPNNRQTGNVSNIQDKSIIGGKSNIVKNSRYPEQIKGGITVIGMNSSVPSKFSAEPGSLIAADIPAARLKEIKKIKKSGSVE